jgi:hypothetical protein
LATEASPAGRRRGAPGSRPPRRSRAAHLRALGIWERSRGPNDRLVATCTTSLSALYTAHKRWADAEAYATRALTIREASVGPEHAEVTESLGTLAIVYTAENRLPKAEACDARIVAITERALGAEAPELAPLLESRASVLHELKRETEAEAIRARAKAIRAEAEPCWGSDNRRRSPASGGRLARIFHHEERRDRSRDRRWGTYCPTSPSSSSCRTSPR